MKEDDYIYILDYSDSTICSIKVSKEEAGMEVEDIIEKHGCNINTSSWMITNIELIEIIRI